MLLMTTFYNIICIQIYFDIIRMKLIKIEHFNFRVCTAAWITTP